MHIFVWRFNEAFFKLRQKKARYSAVYSTYKSILDKNKLLVLLLSRYYLYIIVIILLLLEDKSFKFKENTMR